MAAASAMASPAQPEGHPAVPPWTSRRAWMMGLRLLPRAFGRRLLHLECDTGELVGALYHLGLSAEGMDSEPRAIALARTQWPCARFHRCRFDEFRPGGAYDIIYLSTAGRGWPAQLEAAIDLIDRSLAPCGTVISDVLHLGDESVKAIDAALLTAGFEAQAGFPRSSDDPWWVFRRREPTRH